MNAIILYGSRYGASQTYAQALEARTGIPAVAYQEIQDFGPFDTIVYIGGLYAGKTTGLAKTVRHFPTDHPFRLLVATVGLSDPAVEDNLLRIRESLAQELSPGIFVRTTHVHLRGAIDYSVLTTRHRLMMKGLCTLLRRQPAEDRSPRHPGPAGQLRQSGGFHRPGHPGPHPNLVGKGLKIPFIIAPNRTG